jgi:SHS family lactate transporter-like MFS transporter
LDAFDFTVFLLIMHPIANAFHVPLLSVTFVFTITLWMRLLGATASGWLGDRIGRCPFRDPSSGRSEDVARRDR